LQVFVSALKVVTVVMIALALLDTVSGRPLTMEITGRLFGTAAGFPTDSRSIFGINLDRARATLDHPILYGMFCVFAAAIFLYSERNPIRRTAYFGLCSFGCLLAVSSAPIMCLAIVAAVYCYDLITKQYSWRWWAFWSMVGTLFFVVFLATNKPFSWIIAHLTLDPSTGYYRIMIWDVATATIMRSPLTGFGFIFFDDQVLDNTVDSAWLVYALRFGVPMIAFLFLASIAASLGSGRKTEIRSKDPYMVGIRTGFTLVLMIFAFAALTVHFWNGLWMFWGLCLGIRASLNEYFGAVERKSRSARQARIVARPVDAYPMSRPRFVR
jgi:hypothetical protein